MLTRILLLLIATSSVAFLVYVEVMVILESRKVPRQRTLIMSSVEPVSNEKPRILHVYKADQA